MVCPKCGEGNIIKIKFKKSGKIAFLCDFCDELWFEGEHIKENTGHTLKSFTEEEDIGYTIEELREEDFEHQPLPPTNNESRD